MPTDRLDAAGQREGKTQPTRSASIATHRVHAARASSLPTQLQDAVPVCARQCLAGYIEQGWSCSDSNTGCLCSGYSEQGFTLGELAYICLQQECGQRSHEEEVAAYQICSADRDAVTATHDTLTVPARTTMPTRPTSTAGVGSSDGSSRRPQTTSSTFETSASRTGIGSSSSRNAKPEETMSMASTTSSPSAAAADSDSQGHSTSVSTAQAIGISVACMAVVILAIGIFYLIICMRRRKVKPRNEKQERDSYDFVDEAPPRFSPFHYGYADPRGPLGGFYGQRAELMEEKRNSKWYRDQFLAEPVSRYEKELEYASTPKSLQSRSTISQLLPDKPKATPPHLRAKPLPRPLSTFTSAPTVFEEDRTPQMQQAMFPAPPPPVGLPSNPKAFHYPQVAKPQPARYAEQFTQSPTSMRQPSLSIKIPKQPSRAVKSPEQAHLPGRRSSPPKRNSARSSFLNYYHSPEADALRSPDSATPIDEHIQTRRAVPTAITVTKPTFPPRAVRVTSGASDTSFESTDPDEPTPPEEEEKQLSPVKEHSPIAGIRYPKVPRSSNQAIPRSPPIGGLKGSPALGAQISPARRAKAPPVGAHAGPAAQETLVRGTEWRPLSQVPPRKPVPSNQTEQQQQQRRPVTPDRQVRPQNSSTLSGSTLAAKRRGDTAAHTMERDLHIQDSTYPDHSYQGKKQEWADGVEKPLPPSATRRSPHSSPLKGYGRVATTSRNTSPIATRPPGLPHPRHQPQNHPYAQAHPQSQYPSRPQGRQRYPIRPQPIETGYHHRQERTQEVEAPLKSPPWEPKLTPSRKGTDLYLSVGSATPRTEGFGFGEEVGMARGSGRGLYERV